MSARSWVLSTGYKVALRPQMFRAFKADPESIHEHMIVQLARVGVHPWIVRTLKYLHGSQRHPVTVAGVTFPGRVGLAAGMDKDALAVAAWQSFGFGFVEVGTVTALQQPGNDRPRVFRLRDSRALINRMGFNNLGAKAMADHLHELGIRRGNLRAGIPIGISLGKTKIVPLEAASQDYITSLRMLAPYADYIAINVSSPNTPGLRTLQAPAQLPNLLGAITREADRIAVGEPHGPVPIFLKVAPDLTDKDLDGVLATAADQNIRGIIASNTTLRRDGLAPADRFRAAEAGGLSGAPLTARAREVVRHISARTSLPIIASGGIMTVDAAKAMFDAGARLVQLYTGFIYEGSGLITGINALKPTRSPA